MKTSGRIRGIEKSIVCACITVLSAVVISMGASRAYAEAVKSADALEGEPAYQELIDHPEGSDYEYVMQEGTVKDGTISYMDENGEVLEHEGEYCDISDERFKDVPNRIHLDGWYIATSDRTFKHRFRAGGCFRLIVCDGVTVRFCDGVETKAGTFAV